MNKLYKDSDPSHLKPWQKYQVVKAAWPAILDEKIFRDAQHLLEEAAEQERTRLGKKEKRVFLLTGLLTCGETGLAMVGQAGRGSSGKVHRYYHYPRRPKDIGQVRPRLSANELEEKVLEQFRLILKDQGYLRGLESTLKAQAQTKQKGSASELERTRSELKKANEQISAIWTNQSRMQLNEEALRLASDELNRLAIQKQDLEKYLAELDALAVDPQIYREQALFIENQIRWCMQGWAKATPAVRKRLLRRTIKEIVVTRTELHMTFWKCAEDREESPIGSEGIGSNGGENVVAFRRRSPSGQDHNLSIQSSGKVRNGRASRTRTWDPTVMSRLL